MITKSYLGIGINHFTNFPNATLSQCLKDVARTAMFFASRCDIVDVVPEEQATEAGCKKALMKFKGGDSWPENFHGIICISMHGSNVPSLTEADGADEITCCADFDGKNGGIKDDWWYNYLQDIPASSCVWIIADTCMSTGLTRNFAPTRFIHNPLCDGKTPKSGLFIAKSSESYIDADPDYPGVLIPGCGETSYSQETRDGGALTNAFLKALNENESLTNRQLVAEIISNLDSAGFSQRPTLQCHPDLVDEIFPF